MYMHVADGFSDSIVVCNGIVLSWFTLELIVSVFIGYSLQEDTFLTFLYNDEVHSYDEVCTVSHDAMPNHLICD